MVGSFYRVNLALERERKFPKVTSFTNIKLGIWIAYALKKKGVNMDNYSLQTAPKLM